LSYGETKDLQIVIAGVINGHVAAKYIYVRVFRGTNHMQTRSFRAVGSWVAISLVLWIIAWIIAEAIPVFNNLLSLIVSGSRSFDYAIGVKSLSPLIGMHY